MSIKSQLSMLIGLANADEDFADNERDLIMMIGKVNGVSEDEIKQLIDNPVPMPPLSTMTDDEKFDFLYNVVQLMKVDAQVYLSEIKYCEDIAEKMGFKKKVISLLSSKIYSDPSITSDRAKLQEEAMKYKN
ncbi:MAG: TerB family tellurite resistance protein [Cyclobacteriaceae bacterium]